MFFAPQAERLKVHWAIMECMTKVKCHKNAKKCNCSFKKRIPIKNAIFNAFFSADVCKKSVSHQLDRLGREVNNLHNKFNNVIVKKQKKMVALSAVAAKMNDPQIDFDSFGPVYFINKDFNALLKCNT